MRKWASVLLITLGIVRPAWATSGMVLPNGVRVWAEEDPEAGPLMGIWVDWEVGAGAETTGWAGAAHLLEHLRAREVAGPPARRTAWTTTEQTHFESIGLLSEGIGLIATEVHRQQDWGIRFGGVDQAALLTAERAVMRLEALAREPARRDEAELRRRLFPAELGVDPLGPDGRPEQDIEGLTPERLRQWEAHHRRRLPGGGLVVHLRAARPERELLQWGAAFGAIVLPASPETPVETLVETQGVAGVAAPPFLRAIPYPEVKPQDGPITLPFPQPSGRPGAARFEGPGPKGCTVAFAIPGEGHPDLGPLRALALAWNEARGERRREAGTRAWTDVGAEVGVFFVRWERPCPKGRRALPRVKGPSQVGLATWERRRSDQEQDFVWRGRVASACLPNFLLSPGVPPHGVAQGAANRIVAGVGPEQEAQTGGLRCAQAAAEAVRAGASANNSTLQAVAERWLSPQLGQWGWR